MRLTVHIENAPFITKEQKSIKVTVPRILAQDSLTDDKKKQRQVVTIIKKPKKPKCIVNTLSFKNLKDLDEVQKQLAHIRSKYKIAKWQKGWKEGKEMIYIAH